MILYLSGPISGKADYWVPFNQAYILVGELGHEAINPAFLPNCLDYEECMEICLTMLKHADGIVMLKGWRRSQGARRELKEAIRRGMKVFFGTGNIPKAFPRADE